MRIIKLNDDEWSHSSDDGSGYSNERHLLNTKNMNENKIIDYILGLVHQERNEQGRYSLDYQREV